MERGRLAVDGQGPVGRLARRREGPHRSSASGSNADRMRWMLAREGGVRCPVVGLRKARTAANCGWSSRCANSEMAAAPCAPASFAAAATAKTLASEWRTPRAERNSGTPRRQSNRLRRRHLRLPAPAAPRRRFVCLPRAPYQRVHQHRLRLPMLDPTAARPGEALGLTNRRPVCRQIASALEPGRVHKGLGQQHRMPEQRLHVARQAANGERQHPRGEVANPTRRQNQKTTVVRPSAAYGTAAPLPSRSTHPWLAP